MVLVNNSYAGVNNPFVDAYIRNLNEYRISIELAILPILNDLITNTERDAIKIPAKILESERKFLKHIAEKYHKRKFDFIVDIKTNTKIYDALTKLIRISHKSCYFCVLDFLDIAEEEPRLLKKIKIPDNLIISIEETREIYPRSLPKVIRNINKINKINLIRTKDYKRIFDVKSLKKCPNEFELYIEILANIKKAIDFEILKLYDFLLETKLKQIHSNKLLEVYQEVLWLGEIEYYKKSIGKINILPLRKVGEGKYSSKDIILDEWCSNIRRAVELKKELALDLVKLMLDKEFKTEKRIYQLGGYSPEIYGLLYWFFKGQIPQELKRIKDKNKFLK